MEDIVKYLVKEIKRHFQTPHHYVRLFGKKRDISRVMTFIKVVGATISTASTVSFIISLVK